MSGRPKLPGAARWALLLAVVLAGIWPYLAELGRIPMTADGRLWLERGDPARAGWSEWVFGTRHFQVGYRPVAALSYTATLALRGVDLFALRATDLALHAAAALALAVLVGRLTGPRGEPLATLLGAVAAFAFLAHSSCEEVVPYLARRSYALALLASLGAALCLVRRRPARGVGVWAARSAAGLLVFVALLSNETAALPLAGLALLVLFGGARSESKPARSAWGPRLAELFGPALGAAAAFGVRQFVIGSVGGYDSDADGSAEPGLALARGCTALLGFEPRGVGLAGALVVLAAHLAAARLGGRRERRNSLAFTAWLLAGLALFALLGVWFERLAYALAPAWAALVALHLGRAWTHGSGARRAVLVGALALSAALPLWVSPVLRGADSVRTLKRNRRQAVIEALVAGVDGLESGARLQLVLPYSRFADSPSAPPGPEDGEESEGGEEPAARRGRPRLPRDARVPFRWLKFVRPDTEVRFNEFVYVEEPDWTWSTPTLLGQADGEPAILAPEGRTLWTSGPPRRPTTGERHVHRLLVRPPERRASWFVFLYRPEGGEVLSVPLD